jgi:hypothetical protein
MAAQAGLNLRVPADVTGRLRCHLRSHDALPWAWYFGCLTGAPVMHLRIVLLAAAVAFLLCNASVRAQAPAPVTEPAPVQQPAPAQKPAPVREPPLTEEPAPPPDPVKSVLGAWEFSNSDRDRRCNVLLKEEPATVGLTLEFEAACAPLFPFLSEVVGWSNKANDFLRFLDAAGKSVLDFSELESGLYEALRPGEGVLFLQTVAAVGPPPKSAGDMVGDWTIQRGGKPVCALTLSDKAIGPEALTLTIKQGCDAFVTRFSIASWHMDRGELVLTSTRGDTWRFEEADAKTWKRVPERAEAVQMVRR